MSSSLPESLQSDLEQLRWSTARLRTSTLGERNRTLEILRSILRTRSPELLAANAQDLDQLSGEETPAFRDRLILSPERIEGMIESLRQVEELADPLAEVVESKVLKNGLKTRRIRSPLGVIFMIFESRPNVAIEAFSLALKSGNALILRGGKESRATVSLLYAWIREALSAAGLPSESFLGISDPNREWVKALLRERSKIDVVVPRGGERLIEFVVEHSRIPIIKNDRGMCHVYVHEDADLDGAARIIENAKTQRPGVCNAMETLLVHSNIVDSLAKKMFERESLRNVEYRLDGEGLLQVWREAGFTRTVLAGSRDFDTEYLDLKMNVTRVDSVDAAMTHIAQHGSGHSEAILCRSSEVAKRFELEVDAAAVYWNASTRFTDGFELGLGGELGISTQKLHVRGPVGLRELTSVRWIVEGEGQIR